MKKLAVVLVAVLALCAFAGAALACDGGCMSPMKAKGAKVDVKKTDKGVVITITGDSPDVVKEIQARAEKAGKEGAGGGCKGHKDGEKKGEGGGCPHAKEGTCGGEQSCGGEKSCGEHKEEGKCPHAK